MTLFKTILIIKIGDNMKIRKSVLKTLNLILTLVCIAGIVYSGYHIIEWYKNTRENNNLKNELSKSIEVVKDKKTDDEKINIDFENLKQQNPDTVAYIKVKNTNIDYIVVRGQDNSYYLKHNFNKEWNIAGWIFADYKNRLDDTDRNIVVFGHDTKDGSMFGTLKETQNIEWQEKKDNQIIDFVTEMGQYKYQIFSTYIVEPEEYYINTNFISVEEYKEFVNTIKVRSTYDYKVDVNENDKILTLSSCTPNGTKRVVVHAKRLENSK